MKDDAPAPEKIPQKRRVLQDPQATPDLWLRLWLDKPDLHFREKKRILAEIERRKVTRLPVRLGIIVGPEGVTPQQVHMARTELGRIAPTEVRTVGQVSKLYRFFPADLNTVINYGNTQEVDIVRSIVRDSTVVLAFPKEPLKPDKVLGVWDVVRFAKHRNLPTRIVLPDGSLTEGSK